MAVTVKQEVAALYSAIFNRAPDQAGLEFWVEAINGGDSLTKAAEGFTQHPVFAEVYGDLSNQAKVEALYTNVLGSAGDAAGIQFWVAKLESGISFGQVVAEFVSGALTIDLDALLASGELSQADYDAAVVRQNSITNKADAGVYFADTFGAASNLSDSTDTTTKEGLESDPVYLASQAAIAGVTNDAATLAAAKAAIDAAEVPTDLNVVPAPVFTLTEALATETLPEGYVLSDATADLGALAIADVAAAQAAAAVVVAGAANAAELELAATYIIADTLANVLAADAAALADAASYSLTDATADLGALSVADFAAAQAAAAAVVDGATNAADMTLDVIYTLVDALAVIADEANAEVVAGAASYSLSNEAGDLGVLSEKQQAIVAGAANAGDFTFTAEFTLAGGLAALANAQADKAEFLIAIGDDPKTEEVESASDESVKVALENAEQAVDALVAGASYAEASPAVRAALLADQQALNANNLTSAQQALAAAQADVDAVAGLNQAVADRDAAQVAEVAAGDVVLDAAAALAAAVASFNIYNAVDIASVQEDGTVAGLIELVDGELMLVRGVSEASNKGITAVLNASVAKEAADTALLDAAAAAVAAQEVVDGLDLTPAAVEALEAVAAAMTVVDLAEGALPSAEQIQAEIEGLQALAVSSQETADLTDAVALRAEANAALELQLVADMTDAVELRAAATAAQEAADATNAVELRAAATAAQEAADATNAVELRAAATAAQDAADATNAVELRAAATAAQEAADATDAVELRAAATAAQDAADATDAVELRNVEIAAYEAYIAAGEVPASQEYADWQLALEEAKVAEQADADAQVAVEAADAAEQADADALVAVEAADAAEQADADALIAVEAADAAEQADADALFAVEAANAAEAADAAAADVDVETLQADALAAENADGAAAAAFQDVIDFQGLVDTYTTAADVNPLLDSLAGAVSVVDAAEAKIAELAAAVEALTEAQANVVELSGLNSAIEAAQDAFVENGYLVPVDLTEGSNSASADSDIFVAGSVDSSINDFGLEGNDALFIGQDYTLNAGALADGSDSVLEVFFVQSGADTVVTLEGVAFGSNSAEAEQSITLVGVNAADLVLADGFVTFA